MSDDSDSSSIMDIDCAEVYGLVHRIHNRYPSVLVGVGTLLEQAATGVINPIDNIRKELKEFLINNKEQYAYFLECDGDCFKHPDGQVLWCFLQSGLGGHK